VTPREAAEKRELELAISYFSQRVFMLAGDAAELQASLIEARKRVAELEANGDSAGSHPD
jgi:hypothetical protein